MFEAGMKVRLLEGACPDNTSEIKFDKPYYVFYEGAGSHKAVAPWKPTEVEAPQFKVASEYIEPWGECTETEEALHEEYAAYALFVLRKESVNKYTKLLTEAENSAELAYSDYKELNKRSTKLLRIEELEAEVAKLREELK